MDQTIFMKDITPLELKERISAGEKLHIIDVREQYEYDEFNIGAKLIPLGDLRNVVEDLHDWSDTEVVVHCRSGARSAAAKAFLMQNGFINVRSLLGGIVAYQALEQ